MISSIGRITRLALPVIGGQLGFIMMGFFDTVQVGVLGEEALAAVGLGNTMYFLLNLLGIGILMGIAPLVSEAEGASDRETRDRCLAAVFPLTLLLSIGFMLITGLADKYFYLLGQDKKIGLLASNYLRIVNAGSPALFLFYGLKQVADGMGKTLPGMLITIGGLLLNVALNHWFIHGGAGIPALGLQGAAIATTVSRWIMAITFLLSMKKFTGTQPLQLIRSSTVSGQIKSIRKLLIIGFPVGMMMLFEMASFSIAHLMSGWVSSTALAAHQVAINLASITFMIASGFATAGSIAVGYGYGEKDAAHIRASVKASLILVLCGQILFSLLFLFFSRPLAELYTADARVLPLAATLILYASVFQLSDGLQTTAAGLLRGMQDVKVPSVVAFIAYWLLMVPCCYMLAFTLGMGIEGIWIGFLIGLTAAAGLLLFRLRHKLRSPFSQE